MPAPQDLALTADRTTPTPPPTGTGAPGNDRPDRPVLDHFPVTAGPARHLWEPGPALDVITAEMHEFLAYWLVTHILRDDKAYSPVLTGQTVPEAAD